MQKHQMQTRIDQAHPIVTPVVHQSFMILLLTFTGWLPYCAATISEQDTPQSDGFSVPLVIQHSLLPLKYE
jgi:hypothetical protein